jgi:hypothetical protein
MHGPDDPSRNSHALADLLRAIGPKPLPDPAPADLVRGAVDSGMARMVTSVRLGSMPDTPPTPSHAEPTRRQPLPNPIAAGVPFTRADFEASDLTIWELRRAHRVLFRGVYVSCDTELTLKLLAEAALLATGPDCFLSHHTAARLLGGIVPEHPDVHVSYRGVRAQCDGIFAHRMKSRQRLITFRGLRMTSAEQTFVDMAHVLGLVDLVVLGDSLVRANRTTTEALLEVATQTTGPYSKLAKRAAALVRRGVDSAMESRLRLLIVLAGLPEPEVDHRVFDSSGNLLYRYDLSYPRWHLVIEYDGRQHADSDEQWFADIARDEQLDDWKVRKLVVVSKDIFRTPAMTLARVTKAMHAVGMPVPALSDEWRRHFPSRPGDIATPA